jgi:glycosyltransferase involved in cell wall biosynthesis
VITSLKNGSRSISPVILNVFPTFAIGGSEVRFTTLANSPGHDFRQLVFAIDGRYDCFDRLRTNANVNRSHLSFPRAGTAGNVVAAYKALRHLNPALLVTYNWGAIEWALAATFTNVAYVHVVDGFGPEEAEHQLARRVWFRRLALARCSRIVVPSRTLRRLAKEVWRLPDDQINHIPNGIDADRFTRQPDTHLISALGIPRDRRVVGTVATLRPEKNITRLLHALAQVAERTPVTLVIVGDGAERRALESQVLALGLGDTVIFTGAIEDPARLLGAFDVFAISSDTEQMPISVLEAMAAGLPIAGVDVGDVKEMVSLQNRQFIVDRRSQPLAVAISDLLADSGTRSRIGRANRQRVCKEYTLDRMVRSYTDLYLALIESASRNQAA